MAKPEVRRLRLCTYLVPGLPLRLYQTYQHYLEEVLGCPSYLMVESRMSGPPADGTDPFTSDDVDMGFICSTSYLKHVAQGNKYMELLPVVPVHTHPQSELRPIYFSEIIIRKERAETCKGLWDLRGHRWAYNDEESLSGRLAVQAELKKMGCNTSFFSQIIKSGSHHNSIQLVKDGSVDLAAVDSNTLFTWLSEHPEDKDEIHKLCSLGPFPTPPVVINSRLPEKTRQKICDAFLSMNRVPEWKDKLSKYSVWGFKPIDSSLYEAEKELDDVRDQNIRSVYY